MAQAQASIQAGESNLKREVIIKHGYWDLKESLRVSEGRMASLLDVDAVIQSGKRFGMVRTGTFLVYEAPEQPFGEQVRFGGIKFNVPKEFQGKVNCAFVLLCPDVQIDETGLLTGKIVKVIENYPTANGWFNFDKETGIPTGKDVVSSSDPEARYNIRAPNAYIGAVTRGFVDDGRLIYTGYSVDGRLGVAELAEPEQMLKEPALTMTMAQFLLLRMDAGLATESAVKLEGVASPDVLAPILKLIRDVSSLKREE
jgi:hypothetical protein